MSELRAHVRAAFRVPPLYVWEGGNDLTIAPGVTIDTTYTSMSSITELSDCMSDPINSCYDGDGRIINKGTIKKNKGQIFENTDVGTIEDNSGDVAFNYGTIDLNTKEVWNNVGTVKDNNFYVFDNHGTVTRNKGKVGNSYGGTVTTNEGKLCDLPQGCSRTGQKPDWSILEAGSFEVEVDGFDSPDDAGCHCECAEHHCA